MQQSLDDRATRFRTFVANCDMWGTETRERLLSLLCAEAEDLASALLVAGSAEPALKAEIIAWVVRFREEKQRCDAARPEPVTHIFDYDTTDTRTRSGTPRQGGTKRTYRANFGTTPSAVQFSEDMAALRQDVEKALVNPDTDPAFLLGRIVHMYKTRKSALNSNHEHEVGDELDGMAIRVAGVTAREAAAGSRPKVRFHKPVPDEVAPIFNKQVVSGGLPTLGRRRK